MSTTTTTTMIRRTIERRMNFELYEKSKKNLFLFSRLAPRLSDETLTRGLVCVRMHIRSNADKKKTKQNKKPPTYIHLYMIKRRFRGPETDRFWRHEQTPRKCHFVAYRQANWNRSFTRSLQDKREMLSSSKQIEEVKAKVCGQIFSLITLIRALGYIR